ncbi:DUF938 domain-containing protein [Amphritea pacifica]|uniref:DUF938 domain-containing protein n=1 Tax=Amphritea pacifica TaxID=2811233 RepID=A0ABS2W952_9GAMM|nr:DUF938 domain-containing protein [Amphritea pacifica]MBN0988249.1 DUF938 domain-containing protein [Amphritea pacifica]
MTEARDFIAFSPSAARNCQPILQQLAALLSGDESVLEIGSGNGQHAVYFTEQLTGLRWLPSEIAPQLPLLQTNLDVHGCANIDEPVVLDLRHQNWDNGLPEVDLIFSANTLHIISWTEVVSLFARAEAVLKPAGRVILYGPFRYNNAFTSESNAEFDHWLKARNPDSGIRDFEQVNSLAQAANLMLECDIGMPANNQLLVWRRGG